MSDAKRPLSPPDIQALHRADHWTRVGAWAVLVGTFLPMPVRRPSDTEWHWIWERIGRIAPGQITALLAWAGVAVVALVAVRRTDRSRTVLLVVLPTLAFALYMTTLGVSWGRLGPQASTFTILHARPIATFLLVLLTATSRVRLRTPGHGGLHKLSGAIGLALLLLLTAPLPESWVLHALHSSESSPRSWTVSSLILAECGIAFTAATALLDRVQRLRRVAFLAKAPVGVLMLVLVVTYLGLVDFVPGRSDAWQRLWNVTRWYAFLYGSWILIGAGWYRALLLWTRDNPETRRLEETFS